MDLISKNLQSIKKRLGQEDQKLNKIKDILDALIKESFNNKKFEDLICEFYLKGGILFIKTPRKIVAQELNYYKTQLLEELFEFTKEIKIS